MFQKEDELYMTSLALILKARMISWQLQGDSIEMTVIVPENMVIRS
jgi:hypothetical protein